MPIICTLLFGFAGAFFAGAAAADRAALGTLRSMVIPIVHLATPEMERKGLVLLITGVSCAAFYISFITAIFSKLVDPAPGWEQIAALQNRTSAQQNADSAAYWGFIHRQQRYRAISGAAYNIGLAPLPFSGLIFTKTQFVTWVILIYVAFLIFTLGKFLFATIPAFFSRRP